MNSATAISSAVSRAPRNGVAPAVASATTGSSRFWRTLRNGATTLAVLVAVYALIGFLILPALLKPRLEAALSERTDRQATLRRLEFNPFTFHARLSDFDLSDRDPQRSFIGFSTLDLDVSPASLRYRAPVLDAVRLVRPRIELARNDDGTSSIDDLVKRPSADEAPRLFSLNNIEIEDGTLTLDDRTHGRKLVVSKLGIGIPFVSSLPHDATIRVTPRLEGVLDATPFAVKGNASSPFLDRREATLDFNFDALPLARYAEYVALPGGLELADGTLTTRLTLVFVTDKNVAKTVQLSGSAHVGQLAVTRKDGSRVVAAQAIDVALGKLDWLAHSIAIDRLRIERPEADLARSGNGRLEISDLMNSPQPGASPPSKAWQFTLAEAHAANGTLHFVDRSVTPVFATTLSGIALDAKAIASNGPPGKVELAFDSDQGAHARVQADADVAGAALRGHATVTKLDLPRLRPYYASALNADIRRGAVDLDADFDASMKTPSFTLTKGSASLADMDAVLHDDRDPFLRVTSLAIAGLALDAQKRSVTIEDVQWRGGSMRVLRLADGTLALGHLVRAHGAASGNVASDSSPAADTGWNVVVRKASADRIVADVEDRVPKPPVKLHLSDIRSTIGNIGNAASGAMALDVAAHMGRTGRMHVEGTLDKDPLRADLRIDARGIDIVPVKPYFEARTNVVVTRGAVAAKGHLVYAAAAHGSPRASYKGDLAVTDFGSLDRPTSQDLLRFRQLKVTGLETTTDPLRVNVATIAMDGFYARAILSADAKLNLKELLAPASETATAPEPAATNVGNVTTKELPSSGTEAPSPVSIGRIEVANGEVEYSDFFVRPNYNAHLTDVAGSVTSMSAAQAGDVQFQGKVEGTAPVDLRGTLNPFSQQLQLDLTGKATDVDLPPLTPYSVKYAGYGIQKGKLSLEVHYRIEDRKLAATNRLKLDQLTFGEHVDSPTATKLPVHLAVSLLKDRNGVINLDLPIQGTLDDPRFSVWRVVVQIFVNLITKAVTAPFALLASIGGGGEQLAYVEFAPGRADLSAAATEKLRALAKALNDRPGLKLDAAGRAIPDADREGLKRASLERALRIEKQKALVAEGQSAPALETLSIDPSEYPKLLETVYGNAKLPDKPRNVIGLAKTIPPEEMEALLLASYGVDDEALAALANRRAQAIKEWFANGGGVPPDRIFVVQPKLNADGIKDGGAATRVDFAIR